MKVVRPARKQVSCPECFKSPRSWFDKHFRRHLDDLISFDILEPHPTEAFGCGYCHAQGVLVEGGRVLHGIAELVHHVKDSHTSTSTPFGQVWNISHSFNYVLSGQPRFRRGILAAITADSSVDYTIPSLTWSTDYRILLRELQIMSGKMAGDPLSYEDGTIDALLTQVCKSAAKTWQQPFAGYLPDLKSHGPWKDMLAGVGQDMMPEVEPLVENLKAGEDYTPTYLPESNVPIGAITIIPRLAETTESPIPGRQLRLHEQNLHAFSRSVHHSADAEEGLHDTPSIGTRGSDLPGLDYYIDFARGLSALVQDTFKRSFEHIVGCRLSWWPLTEPEDTLESGHIRVYSMPFVSPKRPKHIL